MLNTKIIAHRGSKGTRPENTLVAFQAALDDGADGIETDVHLSKDNQFIIMHDETIDRTTNGQGKIVDYTLDELKQFSAGIKYDPKFINEKIPTLQEVIQLLITNNFQGTFNLEFKTDKTPYEGIERMVNDYLVELNLPFTIIYSSFSSRSVKLLRELNENVEIAKLFKTNGKAAKKLFKDDYIDSYHPKINWIKKHRFFAPGRKIRPWVVNTTEDMEICYKRKMAAIITDYPRKAVVLKKYLEE